MNRVLTLIFFARLMIVASAFALASGCDAAGTGGKELSVSDAKTQFAKSISASPSTISELRVVPLTGGGVLDALWLGINTADGKTQAWAVPLRKCDGRPCAGKPLQLPVASALDAPALVDLQGPPLKIDLRQFPTDPAKAPALSANSKMPAVLVRTRHKLDSGEQRDTLVLLSAEESPRVLWQEVMSSIKPNGGGFQSFQLSFSPGAAPPWLDIGLSQTTVPAAGQQPFRPGPPLLLQFSYRQDAYQRNR